MMVVLLENERNVAKAIKMTLEEEGLFEVVCVFSEYEFRSRLGEFAEMRPDAFILDVIVVWSEAGIDAPEPFEVQRDREFKAGIRCYRELARNPRTSAIPVFFYSGLRFYDLDDDVAEHSHFVSKDYSDHRLLRRRIREVLHPTGDGLAT